MDLTLLLSSNSDVGAPNEQQEIQSEFRNRETLFKRKGINFSTTTNEGRILRSSQVTLSTPPLISSSLSSNCWLSRKRIEEKVHVLFNIGKVGKTISYGIRMEIQTDTMSVENLWKKNNRTNLW